MSTSGSGALAATGPLELYGEELLAARAGHLTRTWLRDGSGGRRALDLTRWAAPADAADQALLDRCAGPVLDLGCGPGRLTRALVTRGVPCLGVDVAPVAVALARSGGTPVLHASAFDAVLDDTRWGTVLLADGNIGIGGDPSALLRRCRDLLLPGGAVLVELDPPDAPTRSGRVRVEARGGRRSSWFPWAHVSVRDTAATALEAGLVCAETWCSAHRWFARLHDGRAGRP